MISAFQYYFPNVLDGINQKHLKQKDLTSIYQPRFELVTYIKQIEEKPKTLELELMIEDKFIGKIIGRGGCNIDQLRKKTNTNIVIYRKLFDTKRLVVISGEINCIEHAKNTIFEITTSTVQQYN